MDDEASPRSGLGANGAAHRPRWGRRTPYGIRRDGNHGERRVRASSTPGRTMPRSTSAPTIAGSWSRGHRRRLPGRRWFLPHYPPRRRRCRVRPDQRGGFRARGRGAPGLPRQVRARDVVRARLIATAACRAARTAKSSAAASPGRQASNWRSSTPPPRRGSPRPVAPSCLIPPHRASFCSTSAAVRLNWCGSTGPRKTVGEARRRPISSAGPRCRLASSSSARALRRQSRVAR